MSFYPGDRGVGGAGGGGRVDPAGNPWDDDDKESVESERCGIAVVLFFLLFFIPSIGNSPECRPKDPPTQQEIPHVEEVTITPEGERIIYTGDDGRGYYRPTRPDSEYRGE